MDLQRNTSCYIPDGLYEILTNHKTKTIKEIKTYYNEKWENYIDECLSFLIENEFIFFCSKVEFEKFPELDLAWDYPAIINNAIIDLNIDTKIDFEDIFNQLEELGCKNIQIRCYFHFTLSAIEQIGKQLEDRSIKFVEILLKDNKEAKYSDYYEIINRYPRIASIVIHSTKVNKHDKDSICNNANVIFVEKVIKSANNCGIISKEWFVNNIEHYTESQHFNTCLNRKVCIDVDGNIKNCPSFPKTFGNIRDTTIKKAIEKSGFKEMWVIKKDDIDVCRDCEFRYMCSDCRAFIKDPNNIFSQPVKCFYNPYISKWKGDEGYVPIEQCGTYSRNEGFVVDIKKVQKLNEQIWGK